MHHAIAFAIASECCRKLPFARNFRSEDEIFAFHSQKHSSEFLRDAEFAAFSVRFGGRNSLANSRGASEFAFAFAFAAVSLRPFHALRSGVHGTLLALGLQSVTIWKSAACLTAAKKGEAHLDGKGWGNKRGDLKMPPFQPFQNP